MDLLPACLRDGVSLAAGSGETERAWMAERSMSIPSQAHPAEQVVDH